MAKPRNDLDATIAALWRDARQRMLGRVGVLEEACTALRAGGASSRPGRAPRPTGHDAPIEPWRDRHP